MVNRGYLGNLVEEENENCKSRVVEVWKMLGWRVKKHENGTK